MSDPHARPGRAAKPPSLPVPPEMRPVEIGIDRTFYRLLWVLFAVVCVVMANEVVWMWTR